MFGMAHGEGLYAITTPFAHHRHLFLTTTSPYGDTPALHDPRLLVPRLLTGFQALTSITMASSIASLRPFVQQVTHNIPTPIRDVAVSILGEVCYTTLLLDVDPTATDCLKLAVSKSLGIAIIATSSIVKIPQILKLILSKSAAGISFISCLLETIAYLIGLAYNYRSGFPFSTYGETSLIVVQNIVIAVLVLQYRGQPLGAALLVAGLAAGVATLFSNDFIGIEALTYAQAGAGALGVLSKVPQIWTIWQEGTTGQLSAFAVSLCDFFSPVQWVFRLKTR
jgi:mannose-P-dolichol utilization defect protein 1